MALVFLSYTHVDKDKAIRLERDLRSRGHRVWRDEGALDIGAPIPDGVAAGLGLCDFFAIIVTENAVRSDWMRAELTLWAGDPRRWTKILPLMFDKARPEQLSPILQPLKYANFQEDYEPALDKVLERLGEASGSSERRLEDLARLRFAIDLAVSAGTVAMRFYNSSLVRNQAVDERKNAATKADEAAQNEVILRLKGEKQYAHDAVVAEEGPFKKERVRTTGYTWVIDPLDGTVNFDNKIPFFCSAIGVLRDGDPVIGAVYDPVQNEVYYALDGLRTEVWNVSRGQVAPIRTDDYHTVLKDCTVAFHISSREDVAERLLKRDVLLAVSRKVRHLRAFGSGQLALAHVATGRLQAFFQLDTFLWDQVAGVVLVRNAGGVVHDLRRRAWSHTTRDILAAANADVGSAFLDLWTPVKPRHPARKVGVRKVESKDT